MALITPSVFVVWLLFFLLLLLLFFSYFFFLSVFLFVLFLLLLLLFFFFKNVLSFVDLKITTKHLQFGGSSVKQCGLPSIVLHSHLSVLWALRTTYLSASVLSATFPRTLRGHQSHAERIKSGTVCGISYLPPCAK